MDQMVEFATSLLLNDVLPSFVLAGVVLAAIVFAFGNKQAALGSALALAIGVGVTLWWREFFTLIPGGDAWNRLPWLALAALWIGSMARLPEIASVAGWPVRAAVAIAAAWLLIPTHVRAEADWLAPALTLLVRAPASGHPPGSNGGASGLHPRRFASGRGLGARGTVSPCSGRPPGR